MAQNGLDRCWPCFDVECAGRLVLVGKPERAATSGVPVQPRNRYQLDIRNSPLGLNLAYKSSHPGFHTFLTEKCFSCRISTNYCLLKCLFQRFSTGQLKSDGQNYWTVFQGVEIHLSIPRTPPLKLIALSCRDEHTDWL